MKNRMLSISLVMVLVVSFFILATTAGCKVPEQSAIELIPQDANLIAYIQVSKIINDQDLRNACDRAKKEPGQPQTADEALNELDKEMGVDLRDFSEAVMFADVATLEQAGYMGFIIEGTFDEKQFVDNIEEKVGEEFTTSDYKGYKLYIDEEEEFGIAFLSDRMLLLGTTKAVKDIIDVSKGDRKQVSGTVLDAYNRLGDALIKFVFELPEEARKTLTEEPVPGEIPISLEPLENIDMLGFALNKEAETITTQIIPHFASIDSAEDFKDTISGAISLFKGMLQVPEVEELLGKTEVSVTDSWVTVAFNLTLSEIEGLTDAFQPQ